MDSLGDLLTRERRSDDPALRAPRGNRSYDYRRFCTTAWKTGNFWRRRGVHEGATVAVADDPEPEAVFSFLGAALLGARTRFGLPESPGARVAVATSDEIATYEVPPGSQRIAYGGPPDDPGVAHFERAVWSENPAFPDTPVAPETTALVAGDGRELSHADLLSAAREVADEWGLEPGDEVAVRAPLAEPGAVAAGVVAPLLAGAATLFPDESATGDYAVGEGDAPEKEVAASSDVI